MSESELVGYPAAGPMVRHDLREVDELFRGSVKDYSNPGNTRTVAIIPARSGSVGVKDKNIRNLGGQPLIAWSINALKQARYIDRVIVDTDSEGYAEIARYYGAETPWRRPKDLAEDVPTEQVLINSVNELASRGDFPGIILCVQCTTPLIRSYQIEECVANLWEGSADSSMTVCEISERPEWMFSIVDDELKLKENATMQGEWGVRQTFPKYYRPNGACYAMRTQLLMEKQRIIGDRCKPVIMSTIRSIDIDTEDDFRLAECLIRTLETG